MTIIDICMMVTVLVYLSAVTYEYITSKIDDMYKKLYYKELQNNEYLIKQLEEKEKEIKELKDEKYKNS